MQCVLYLKNTVLCTFSFLLELKWSCRGLEGSRGCAGDQKSYGRGWVSALRGVSGKKTLFCSCLGRQALQAAEFLTALLYEKQTADKCFSKRSENTKQPGKALVLNLWWLWEGSLSWTQVDEFCSAGDGRPWLLVPTLHWPSYFR